MKLRDYHKYQEKNAELLKPTCIVIDDDKAITELFKDVLDIIGLDVVGIGYDGDNAVELYEKHKPDVVFTDIMMPGKDGFYAVEKIREINPHSKIIAVTADLSNETTKRLTEMKITAIIHKPFDINSF